MKYVFFSMIYIFFMIAVGAFQFLILFLNRYISGITFDWQKILISGFLLFFSISLLGGTTFEYFYDNDIDYGSVKRNKIVNGLIVIVAFGISLAVGISYSNIVLNFDNLIVENFIAVELVALSATLIYAFLLKLIVRYHKSLY